MDYEIMMNGTVRIGQRAPEFEANIVKVTNKKIKNIAIICRLK